MRFIGKFNLNLKLLGELSKEVPIERLKGGKYSPAKPVLLTIPDDYRSDFERVFLNQDDKDRFFSFYDDYLDSSVDAKIGMIAKLKDTGTVLASSPKAYDFLPSSLDKKVKKNSHHDNFHKHYVEEISRKRRRINDETRLESLLREIYTNTLPRASKGKIQVLPSTHKVPYDIDLYDYVPEIHEEFDIAQVNKDPFKQFFYYEVQPAINTQGFRKGSSTYKSTKNVLGLLSKYLPNATLDYNPRNWMVSEKEELLSFDPLIPNRTVMRNILENYYR